MKICLIGVATVAVLAASIAAAAVVEYDWTVDYMSASPDCVEKLVLSINNQFPSPTIHAAEGDTLVVRVTNALPTEGVVLHWHGIHQVR